MIPFNQEKSLLSSLTTWNKVSNEMCQRITKQQLELIGENIARISKQMQRLSVATKPEEFINVQNEMIHSNLTAGIKNLQTLMETSQQNIEELGSLCKKKTESTVSSKTKLHKRKTSRRKRK